jgi:hypothetical protein
MGAPPLRTLQGWVAILLIFCLGETSFENLRLYRQRRIPPLQSSQGWGTHLSGMG